MPKILNQDQISAYRECGFLFPFDLYEPDQAAKLQMRFEALEKAIGDEPQERYRVKAHLPFPWLCEVVRAPKLLDAVEDLIGPDVLCWGASFFAKKAHDPRYVSWHTDSFFYGFEPAETLTAWLAFNPSNERSGCVKYIPGSHKSETTHDIMPDADNLLPMAQNAKDVPLEKAVSAVLEPGQVVFHHEGVVHGSGPNNAAHPRVGLSIPTSRRMCAKPGLRARPPCCCAARTIPAIGAAIRNRTRTSIQSVSRQCWIRASCTSRPWPIKLMPAGAARAVSNRGGTIEPIF